MEIQAKSLTFEEKLNAADDNIKAIYDEMCEALVDKRVKSRITKTSINFSVKKVPLVKIRVMKKGLQMYFALDPNDEKYAKTPHKDASDKKTYVRTPFVFKVASPLSVKRAKVLIADVLATLD